MRFDIRIPPIMPALLLVALGVWYMAREVLHLGPWFGPATLGALAAAALIAYFVTRRSFGWLILAYLMASWSAYEALDASLGLPGSFLPAFWGLAFCLIYTLHTRPAKWPLIPAALFLGLATLLYVIGIGVATARYWVPAAVVLYGIYLIFGRRRGGGGRGGGTGGGGRGDYIDI